MACEGPNIKFILWPKKVKKKRGRHAGQFYFTGWKYQLVLPKNMGYAGSTRVAISICLRNTCMIMQFLFYGFNLYTLLV